MLQAYDEGRLDKLYVVSNKFNNTMSQTPTITQLLPLPPAEGEEELKRKHGITCTNLIRNRCWTPCCVVMSNLRFIRVLWKTGQRTGRAYGGDESGDRQRRQPDQELQLVYNKARQASITQNLPDRLGASAV